MKQQYVDFHIHSSSSPDSKELLKNHIITAQKVGLSQICVTDHWDLVEEVEGFFPTLQPDIAQWHDIFKNQVAQANLPEIKVHFGVEVGDGYSNPKAVTDVIDQYPFDFIIGSVHCLYNADGMGIYEQTSKLKTPEEIQTFLEDYFHTLLLHSQQDYFHTLAHINYPFRYLQGKTDLILSDFMEPITAILENLIRRDKCLELNSSRGSTVDIWKPILQRYQELGGKLLTLGSDAHVANHLGLGIPPLVDLLKSLNYQQYYCYSKKIPQEIPII